MLNALAVAQLVSAQEVHAKFWLNIERKKLLSAVLFLRSYMSCSPLSCYLVASLRGEPLSLVLYSL